MAASAGKRFDEVDAIVIDLGDRVGLLRPIGVQAPCLACHGAAEGLAPEIRDRIGSAYPGDRATGFQLGELRGFFWAEAPKRTE